MEYSDEMNPNNALKEKQAIGNACHPIPLQ
jgi:hypothetical protein